MDSQQSKAISSCILETMPIQFIPLQSYDEFDDLQRALFNLSINVLDFNYFTGPPGQQELNNSQILAEILGAQCLMINIESKVVKYLPMIYEGKRSFQDGTR